MASVNKVIVLGNLGRDPELRHTPVLDEELVHKIVSLVAQLLVQAGTSPGQILRKFKSACQAISASLPVPDREFADYVARVPDVLALWHTDPLFITVDREPRPLPIQGRGASLTALIHRVFPQANVAGVTRFLVQSGSVGRRGRLYYAKDAFVSFAEHQDYARAHSLQVVKDLLQTLEHNLTTADPAARMLERCAVSHAIPLRHLAQAHIMIKAQLGRAVMRIDRDLRSFEVVRGSEPAAGIRVEAFASQDAIVKARGMRRRPSKKRAGRGARKSRGSATS